jgi:hypothetical protein
MSEDPYARFVRHQLDKQIVSDNEPRDPNSVDPWEKLLKRVETRSGVTRAVNRDGRLEWRTKSRYLLTEVIGIPPERANRYHGIRLGVAMRRLGWVGPKDFRFGREKAKGYAKPDSSDCQASSF